MRLRFLRPVNGWSGFLTELAIVVLGVLIALGAQQMVDDWHTRRDVADVRQALDSELGRNLESYGLRIEQGRCTRGRLEQLSAWADQQEQGRVARLVNPIARPISFSLQFSVWEQAGDVVSRMPLKDRLAFADLYDALRNYDDARRREIETWSTIRDFEGAKSLDPQQVFRLRGLITRARSVDQNNEINWPQIVDRARALGVRRVRDPSHHRLSRELCDALRWQED